MNADKIVGTKSADEAHKESEISWKELLEPVKELPAPFLYRTEGYEFDPTSR